MEAVDYLISRGVSLDGRDQAGNTPLHVAASRGNSRVCRDLLIAGADPALRNNDQKTPPQLIEPLLKGVFEQGGCLNSFIFYYNCKLPNAPVSRSYRLTLLFSLLLSSINLLSLSILKLPAPLFYAQLSLFLVTALLFLRLLAAGPGKLVQAGSLLELLRQVDQNDVCFHCEVRRVPRSRHCEICGACVRLYDHHCPWINNCVGHGNNRAFLVFLLVLLANVGTEAASIVLGAIHYD